ncbi:MAG: transport-associated protein [Niastella sp. SCN 39-18]|nr:BON domain-containing protein [Sphingobacteriales bacterium]ODT52066.1 MAG: transport-associated protein [Niastella sp. SCN 39-18]OJW11026.1 MAG: transport-associated protein [Sphingobacteriales bacterium 39-19]
MKMTKVFLALLVAGTVSFVSCKPKDADVKASVDKVLVINPDYSNAVVTVTDGVATLTGEVKDDATKAALEASVKNVKGVKSVVNNTVVPAPVAPPVIAADDPLTAAVKDATKDYPGVMATVKDGVISLTGTIEKSKLVKLMQALNGLNPKSIDNKLTVK